jgi:hypothetical protein
MEDPDSILLEWEPSPSPDVAGYIVYEQQIGGTWQETEESPIPASETSILLQVSGVALSVSAIDRVGNEGIRSQPVVLAIGKLALHGPFPHPVTTSCRFRITVPREASASQTRLRIFSSSGRLVDTLYEAVNAPIGEFEIGWDRLDGDGGIAAPGFYLAVLEVGNRRIERRIFLSP